MTRQWSDERLDAALRELVHARAEEIGAAARPVDVVSARLAARLGVDADTQRRAWRPHRRETPMSNTLKIASAGVAGLLLLGMGLYFSQTGGVGGPGPSPSPAPSPTAAPTAAPTPQPTLYSAPLPLPGGDLEPGTYLIDRPPYFPVRITFDVPDGWSGEPGTLSHRVARVWKPTAGVPDYSTMIAFWIVDRVSADPCATDSMPWVGPTVDHLATVIAGWPGFDVSGPTDVALGAYQGKSLEFTVPDDSERCFGGDFDMWQSGSVIRGPNAGDHHRLWVLDVDGTRLVVEVVDFPGSSDQARAESLQIFESIHIGGVGALEPLAHAMSTARSGHTATLLSDGRVLIAGGTSGGTPFSGFDDGEEHFLSSAETYDHSTGQLTGAGSMTGPRLGHTATLLADGRVLMTGGWAGTYAGAASTEIYDPASGTFSPSDSMGSARRDHTATLLPDGRVLIAGGRDGEFWQTAEVYDPESGRFAPTGLMTSARLGHTATLLADGRVLIAGGRAEASAEIYDPASGTFTATGSLAGLRGDHTATLLVDGRVLIVGGCALTNPHSCIDFGGPGDGAYATNEIYDPATETFAPADPMVVGRHAHTATLLFDGRVLITGGVASHWDNRRMSESERLSAEIWYPDVGTFAAAASLGAMRAHHTATLLPDGRVLIAGGQPVNGLALDSVELYQP